ncbi:ABC transporter substrate-binding protein [Halodurantibacterium flavum]|uniref:ABC transporter substrate-binding protein n=1 Tax=Halodurantibacterium flavum TaxID=1382802 RepID=A0ABW4S6F8_9RHOB
MSLAVVFSVLRPLLLALAVLASAGLAAAQEFPQTFPHVYGETVVPERPQRVVSIGYVGHDNLLALGIVPVGLRHWYGDTPRGVWPWAEAVLGDANPVVLRGEVSLEQVAALSPDLILAISSGITAEEYAVLSQIAPTIASEAHYGSFGTPWQVQILTTARAVGRLTQAEEQLAALEARIADIRAAHPDWQGMTAVAAYAWAGVPGAFRSSDSRTGLLNALGFVTPAAIDSASGAEFYTSFSPEDLSVLDTDLLVWIGDQDDGSGIRSLALRQGLRAHQEGREIHADGMLAGALGHATLLSLPYALDRLIPEIEAAVDGDPATPVPSAVAAGLAPRD